MYLATQVWHLKLNPTTSRVLMALCDSAEDDGSRCFPSPLYVAWKTGMGKSTVYRVMEQLEAQGVLEQVDNGAKFPEYQIHLELIPAKTPWNRRRPGRPKKSVSEGDEYSHSGKTFPTVGNIFPEREIYSQSGKIVSQSGTAEHVQQRPPRRKKSGAKAGGVSAELSLENQTYRIKPIDSGSNHIAPKEKPEETPAPKRPAVKPITEIRREVGETPLPPVAPPPSPAIGTWRRMRSEIDPLLSPTQRREWIERCDLYRLEADDWVLVAPTTFAAELIQTRWGEHLRVALHHAAGPDAQLLITTLQKAQKGAHV